MSRGCLLDLLGEQGGKRQNILELLAWARQEHMGLTCMDCPSAVGIIAHLARSHSNSDVEKELLATLCRFQPSLPPCCPN